MADRELGWKGEVLLVLFFATVFALLLWLAPPECMGIWCVP